MFCPPNGGVPAFEFAPVSIISIPPFINKSVPAASLLKDADATFTTVSPNSLSISKPGNDEFNATVPLLIEPSSIFQPAISPADAVISPAGDTWKLDADTNPLDDIIKLGIASVPPTFSVSPKNPKFA